MIKKMAVGLTIVLGGLIGLASSAAAAAAKPSCHLKSTESIRQAAEPFRDAIDAAAARYHVPAPLIEAVIHGSSCFRELQVSEDGAIGLMQLMPATAQGFGALDVFDTAQNIDAGARYLAYLLRRYEGDVAAAVAAFVADEGWEWQQEAIHVPFTAVQNKVARILDTLHRLDGNAKAYKQAQARIRAWAKSSKAYRTALTAIPVDPLVKAHQAWFKERLAKVHYRRAPDDRSCAGFSTKVLEGKAAPYAKLIQQAAKRHKVNPALIHSVIAAESCYREMVVSPKGASGLMQLMPETAEELGVMDMFDPAENINAGTRYLAWLLRRYNGSVTHAIAAYNAGPGRIPQEEPVTIGFTETRGYIRKVLTGLVRLEKGEQGIANAQLLLANWEQAELEYQAALKGIKLEKPEPETAATEVAEAALVPPQDTALVAGQTAAPSVVEEGAPVAVPDALVKNQPIPAAQASMAEEVGAGKGKNAVVGGRQAKVRLLSATTEDMVRVRSVRVADEFPVLPESPAASAKGGSAVGANLPQAVPALPEIPPPQAFPAPHQPAVVE